MEKPVVGDVERGSAQLKSAGTEPQSARGGDFLVDGLGKAVKEQDELLAGADAQAGRNEVGVARESAIAVAENAGDGERDGICRELGLAEEDEVLAGKSDRVLALANGIVSELVLDGGIARTWVAAKIAVEALVMAGWDGQVEGDLAVGGREEIAELDGIWRCVAVGEVEDETVGQDAGREIEDGEAVAQGLRIDGKVEKAPGVLAQIGIQKPERIFEVPALSLEMVRPGACLPTRRPATGTS